MFEMFAQMLRQYSLQGGGGAVMILSWEASQLGHTEFPIPSVINHPSVMQFDFKLSVSNVQSNPN